MSAALSSPTKTASTVSASPFQSPFAASLQTTFQGAPPMATATTFVASSATGGKPLNQNGKSTFFITDSDSLCLGRIGTSSKLCCKLRQEQQSCIRSESNAIKNYERNKKWQWK